MVSFTVFVRDRVVLVHDLKTMVSFTVLEIVLSMVSFTVFVRDRVVLVHDLKAMVSFTVFVGDRVVVVHDLKPWFHLRCSLEIVLS